MKDITEKNFGVIIAFLIPGFMLLWGLSYSSDEISKWFAQSGAADAPTVGGFLYATLASLALGLLVSAVRWLIVDRLLHSVSDLPEIDFEKLKNKDTFTAFEGVVENHYRYYQYYSNTLVAVIISFLTYLIEAKEKPSLWGWAGVVFVIIALLLASNDCLKKYHQRAAKITV